MKDIIKPLILIFFSCSCCFAQLSEKEKLQIKESLKLELSDSLTKKLSAESDIKSMIDLLDSSMYKGGSLFPYQDFEFAMCKFYRVDDGGKSILRYKIIRKEEALQLLAVINNPLNFRWGECGTPMREVELEFFNNEKVVARINFACSRGSLTCSPENPLIRWGLLNDSGIKKLYEIGLWE